MDMRFSRTFRLALVIAATFVGGCDNAAPEDKQGELPTYTVISVPVAIDDIAITDRRDSVFVDLREHFVHTDGQPMSFSVATTTGAIAAVKLDPVSQRVEIVPIASGSAVVTVIAKDARGYSGTTSFNVVTNLDPCPRQPLADEVDFFRFQLGDQWIFSYDYRDVNSTPRDINGTLTWEVIDVEECVNGVSRYDVVSKLEGTVDDFNPTTGSSTWQLREETTFTIVVEETVSLGAFFSNPIERIWPASSPDTLSLTGKTGGDWATLEISKNVGVVGRSKWVHYSANGDIWETITLLSHESQ